MVPFKSLQVAQIRITKAKTPVAVVVSQLDQPRCHFLILCIELELVTVTRLTDPECLAGHPNANSALLDCFDGHLLRRDGLTTFFLEPPRQSRPFASPQGTAS